MKNKIVGIITCLIFVALLTAHYLSDSFIIRRTILPHGTSQSGVIFHDKMRSQKGHYNIVNTYLDDVECNIVDMDGTVVYDKFPHGFCYFFQDQSFLVLNHTAAFYAPDGNLIWEKPAFMGHDFDVSDDENEIFFVCRIFLKNETDITEGICGLNRAGEPILTWRIDEHFQDFKKALGRDPTYEPTQFKKRQFKVPSHLNSVQILRSNPYAAEHPEFSQGNLLINDFQNAMAFIIDRKGQIVWSHVFTSPISFDSRLLQNGAHTVKMLSNGDILYFHNLESYSYISTEFSAIVKMNPVTHEPTWRFTADPVTDFFSRFWGSVFQLENANMIVTNTAGGNAFELTPEGRIVWEWINPRRDSWGLAYPVYQIKRISKQRVDPVIHIWKMKD